MSITVRQEVLDAAVPGEGIIARELNNFHGRLRGGYKRRLLQTAQADKKPSPATPEEAGKYSQLRLDQTLREFFATIDGLLDGLNLGEDRVAAMVKVAGTSARRPEDQAALTEYEKVARELYKALRLMGYSDADIVG
jgi:hypothetical protein